MEKGKWYELWAAHEANVPMNFGKYIGKEKEQDPGAGIAKDILTDAHNDLLAKIKKKNKHTDEEIKDLENFLTNLFFPSSNGGSNEVTQLFLKTLIKSYNTVYDDMITTENFGEDITKQKVTQKEATDILKTYQKIRSGNDKNKATTNKALKTIKQQIKDIGEIINSVDPKSLKTIQFLRTKIKPKIGKMYSAYDEIVALYASQVKGVDTSNAATADPDSEWNKIRSTMLINQDRIMDYQNLGLIEVKDGNKNAKADLQKTLQEFEAFYDTLNKMFCVTPSTYGNFFEYGLALVNQYGGVTSGEVEKWTSKKLKALKNEVILGDKNVSRGGGSHFLAVDTHITFSGNETEYDEENDTHHDVGIIKRDDGFDNIKIRTDSFNTTINTGEEKSAKVDVMLTAPDAAGKAAQKLFNVSAKNWNMIDSFHDLSSTSLLRGIDRTLSTVSSKEEALLNYIYVLQHPVSGEQIPNGDSLGDVQTRRPIGTDALSLGHKLAKESLVVDIAMGLSQGNNMADTLIIMDRTRKKIVIINIVEELVKYLEDGDSSFYLVGYNGADLESAARTFRNEIREGASYVARDRNYVSLMKIYLDSKKASVKLTQKFIDSVN